VLVLTKLFIQLYLDEDEHNLIKSFIYLK